jgi:phosphinothricin acetyltransferase
LLARLADQGYRVALAVIALPNDASVGLHEACGFELVGVYRDIGFKFGSWWDVGWWQLDLGRGLSPDPALKHA